MNKEIEDASHTLLHCSLKDTEYETQKEQFKIVYDYIQNLQNKINKAMDLREENQKLKGAIETYDILLKSNVKSTKVIEELEKWLAEQYEFITKAPAFTKEIAQEHKVMSICYENTLDKLKQLQEEE